MAQSIPTLCGSIASSPNYLGAEIHNAGYVALGLSYKFVAFGTDDTESAMTAVRSLGIRGLGIGVPHKQAVMSYLDAIDPVALEIGAVNVVVNDSGKLTGFNVDWIGAAKALQESIGIAGSRSIVVGAGGAARAIIYALVKNGGQVTIYNRSEDKAKRVAEDFGITYGGNLKELESAADYDVLINATSAGFYNKNDCAIPPELIKKGKIVFEAVHIPVRTPLVFHAEEKGAKVIYGYKMLLHLAGHIFELFTGKEPPLEAMEQALLNKINDEQPGNKPGLNL